MSGESADARDTAGVARLRDMYGNARILGHVMP